MSLMNKSKSMAKALRKALSERQIELSYSACLEITARELGFSNWNMLCAASNDEAHVDFTIYVEHGRELEAVNFYKTAFEAITLKTYEARGVVTGADIKIGSTNISVSGSNPTREAEPFRGGPFFPKAPGAVNSVFRLHVRNANLALDRAVQAGAHIRDGLQYADIGCKVAVVIDLFGYIWALIESSGGKRRHAA